MKVKELIEVLKRLNVETEVMLTDEAFPYPSAEVIERLVLIKRDEAGNAIRYAHRLIEEEDLKTFSREVVYVIT